MPVDRTEVLKIADLARLNFSDAELDSFTSRFQRILDYVEKLREVDVEGIEPTSHISAAGPDYPFREDEPRPSLPAEEALANAPDAGDGHFRVPKVIGGE